MKDRPWFKKYARDWLADPAIRLLSPAARGILADLECLVHQATPVGHLLINGDKVSTDELARILGVPPDVLSALLAELTKGRILKMTRAGVLTHPQMIAQHAASKKGAVAVEKRWSAEQDARSGRDNHEIKAMKEARREVAQAPEKQEKSRRPNRSPNREPITHSQSQSQIFHNMTFTSAPRAPPPGADEDRLSFPASGSIAYTEPWADEARRLERNIDLDILEIAFMKWLGRKKIPADAPKILEIWVTFVARHRV